MHPPFYFPPPLFTPPPLPIKSHRSALFLPFLQLRLLRKRLQHHRDPRLQPDARQAHRRHVPARHCPDALPDTPDLHRGGTRSPHAHSKPPRPPHAPPTPPPLPPFPLPLSGHAPDGAAPRRHLRESFHGNRAIGPGAICRFNGQNETTATVASNGMSLLCTSPPSYYEQWVALEVKTLAYTQRVFSRVADFYYHAPMLVSSVYPQLGPMRGGTQVEVRGNGFPSRRQWLHCGWRASTARCLLLTVAWWSEANEGSRALRLSRVQ